MGAKPLLLPVLLMVPIALLGCQERSKSADDAYRDQVRAHLENTAVWEWTCIDFFNAFSGRYGASDVLPHSVDRDQVYKACAKKRGEELATYKPLGYLPADDRPREGRTTPKQPKESHSQSQPVHTDSGHNQSDTPAQPHSEQPPSEQPVSEQPPDEQPPWEQPPSDEQQNTTPESDGSSDSCTGGC